MLFFKISATWKIWSSIRTNIKSSCRLLYIVRSTGNGLVREKYIVKTRRWAREKCYSYRLEWVF
jgi:hypothetical protein